METVSILLYVILFLSTLLSYPFLRKQKRGLIPMNRFKLPPGSMGWPYVGETLQLYSQDPNIFFSTKQKRYGEIFKTHILGCPCVMLASPEAARFVLVTHARLFKPTYPKSKEKMIGPYALFFHQGEYHTRLRKLVQSSLAPDTIRKLIPGIEDIAVSALESWAGSGQVINTFYEMKKTAYHKALLARKRLNQILGEIICERKEKGLVEKDLLGHLLNFKDEKGQTLTEDKIADNIIGVLFAAQDTTASVITWILKFLRDDPRLLEAVKAEQKAIYDSNDGGKRPLTWAQTRSMPLTCNELAKLEALILIHHLVTKFRWEVVGSQSGIQYGPFPVPQQGLPTRFWKDSSRDVCPLVTDLGKNSSSIAATKLFCS
ncbi:Abscisic acid 8'-hydroxylase 4 isoform 3 [Theobroma cacao]|uniref:Abscisic acid 8'-hydroxylase 4 isoform 3 n=1 Tax=Theobroma cacao TaxID=3641 RepID=A0A061DZY6_THECC|nr:Abscisic acid 8'-hydroxylase 4 isoform 3 [Theobroma cacao]